MSARRRGLGSGLDALIGDSERSDGAAVRQIPLEAIRENRSQPRTRFDEQALEELAASIREHGLIQPVIVSEDASGGYELIAGERRLRAARRAGLPAIPALVKSATPQQLLELALVENVQRADLNALEEGLAYQTLKDEFGLTDELIAQRVGKSRVAVVNTRRLIKLITPARQALLEGTISAGHGRALLRLEEAGDQAAALELILRRELTVREAERLSELLGQSHLLPAARNALLSGGLSVAHAQAMLRVDDAQQQGAVLEQILGAGLSVRETEQVSELLSDGKPLEAAIAQVRGRSLVSAAPAPASAAPAPNGESRAARAQSPEDREAQRMLEAALETPVQLLRSNDTIRVTITFYSDEQLHSFYDLLTGDQA